MRGFRYLGIVLLAALVLSGCGGSGSQLTSSAPAPSIASLSPASAAVAAPVTITGTNFGSTQGTSTITFNGTMTAAATVWSATSITVLVPAGATTGNVVVTVNGVASVGAAFTVLPTPSISGLSPTSAVVGAPVMITGTNFGATQGNSTVTFNGILAANATAWSTTSITVSVPAGATTGNVVVTVNGVASAGAPFTVLLTPSISSLFPASAAVGAPVTITGTNFGAAQGASTVTFNGVAGSPSNWSATSITVSVPAGATTGNVVVTVSGVSSVGAPFTVVPVSISPQAVELVVTTQTQQFTASGAGGAGIAWSVDGVTGGNATVGTISTTGLYTPPSTAGTHTVTVTIVANPADSASANVAVTDLAGVFTYHNDLAVDGANTQEYGLTPASVNTNTFGKLFACSVDGATYTQPLWVPSFNIGGGIHNVIFVATEHDSLFAFDADANPCKPYWQANLLDAMHGGSAGETPVPWQNVGQGSGDIRPEIGVTGTPVIDAGSDTIYVVSKSEDTATGTFYQRLHALDLATGNETSSAPVLITAAVPGVGDGSSGGVVSFDPQTENQRPGLALAGGVVYLSWASHEDTSPFHGWVIGYAAADVQTQVSVYNATPNGGLGGIWAAGGSPAVDGTGSVYVSTGNGVFDGNGTIAPNNDFGDSVLRLDPSTGLTVTDWFTPDNEKNLEDDDSDLCAGGIVLLPDQTTGPVTHLLVAIGKGGIVYLVNRDNMGHFQAANNSQIVQSFTGSQQGMWGTSAFWQNSLYVGGKNDSLRQFTFNPSTGLFTTAASSLSTHVFPFPGAAHSVSSQGASNGIVWAIDASLYGSPVASGPAILYAYDAADLAVEYWDSTIAPNNRDQAGTAVKFVPPTIANGKVYVSTRTEIDVYGLLP